MAVQTELGSELGQLAANLLWQMRRLEAELGAFMKQVETGTPSPKSSKRIRRSTKA